MYFFAYEVFIFNKNHWRMLCNIKTTSCGAIFTATFIQWPYHFDKIMPETKSLHIFDDVLSQ